MLEAVIRKVIRRRGGAAVTHCPDAETLACYLDQTIDVDARKEVEVHLAECETCLDQVVLCSADPETVEARTGSESNLVDVVVRFFERAAEVVRSAVQIQILPAPVAELVRGADSQPATLKCVRFGRTFEGLTVEVEVEAADGDVGDIRVEMSEGGSIVEDVRVTLVRRRRELDSSLARGGSVRFDEVEFGDYVIRLSRQGCAVGEVSLRLESG